MLAYSRDGPHGRVLSASHNSLPSQQGDVHQRAGSEGDEDACVVCLAAPATTALVHGSTGHRCCCQPCAVQLKSAKQTCPMCRQPFDQIVQVF